MKNGAVLAVLLALALAVLAVAPFWGIEHTPLSALWSGPEDPAMLILWKIRIPRVAMAFLVGTALAASGMAFQAMFRNPLATPFTLGVSSGASLGAALAAIYDRWAFVVLGISSQSIFAMAGAAATILLVYGLTRAKRGFSTATMLLAGVAINFFFSSLILFLQYKTDPTRTFRILRWMMGGLEHVDRYDVLSVLPFVVSGCLIVFAMTHELNLLTTGEELATSRGVEVDRTKKLLFFAASLMVGGVVAFCGPIGFVGLMVPHICRLLVGPDHRWLAPATLLFGGAFLVLCDTVARTILAPAELPVGIITALLGGPFFLWLLVGRPGSEV